MRIRKIQCFWTKDGLWLASDHFVPQICKEPVNFRSINRFSVGGRAEFLLKDGRGENPRHKKLAKMVQLFLIFSLQIKKMVGTKNQ